MTDRTLDAYIAEHVMGWKPMRRGLYWSDDKHRAQMILDSDIHQARIKLGIEGDCIGDGFVFAPSTDPAADYQVLERVRETDPDWLCRMREELKRAWDERAYAHEEMTSKREVYGCTQYLPGDYSRAAATVLDAEGER